MNPLQKRNNPFSTPATAKPRVAEPIIEEIEEIEQFEEEIAVSQPKPAPRTVKKVVVEQDLEKDRVKYTSTMDRKLRRAIKIICAERGLLFASFVEEACREKLRREGVL